MAMLVYQRVYGFIVINQKMMLDAARFSWLNDDEL